MDKCAVYCWREVYMLCGGLGWEMLVFFGGGVGGVSCEWKGAIVAVIAV